MRNRSHQRRHKGVVLLVVMSLLVLFVLLSLTLIIAGTQYRRAAETMQKRGVFEDPPEQLMDEGIHQLLHGPASNHSSLWGNEILRDAYGGDAFLARLSRDAYYPPKPAPPQTSEFILLEFDASDYVSEKLSDGNAYLTGLMRDTTATMGPPPATPFEKPGYYAGRVITMLDGPAKGYSSRIVDFRSGYPTTSPPKHTLVVEAFETEQGSVVLPTAKDRFLVNGAPMNGSGYGYNPSPASDKRHRLSVTVSVLPDATSPGNYIPVPIALLPHYARYLAGLQPTVNAVNTQTGFSPPAFTQPFELPTGDADEGYDAVDYLNLFLGHVPSGITPQTPLTSSSQITPSFHRPDLINYLLARGAPLVQTGPNGPNYYDPVFADFWRNVVLRPLRQDHPDFDGSNPRYNFYTGLPGFPTLANSAIAGPPLADVDGDTVAETWDVDNDNDGIPDSIWIDIGMPVKTDRNGRLYKPLFAFLIQALDGRVNVNASGNWTHILHTGGGNYTNQTRVPSPSPDPRYVAGAHLVDGQFKLSNPNDPMNPLPLPQNIAQMIRGRGAGPAEIDLYHVISDPNEYRKILDARYGAETPTNVPSTNSPGLDIDDSLSLLRAFGLRRNYPPIPPAMTPMRSWGSPFPLWGQGAIGVDHAGNPVFAEWERGNMTINDPYESNLVSGDSHDNHFTLTEMERLLRRNDSDSTGLSDRLERLAPTAFPANQALITTASFSNPTPLGQVPFDKRPELEDSSHTDYRAQMAEITERPTLVDLLEQRIRANLPNPPLGPPPAPLLSWEDFIRNEIRKLMPFEIVHGERFDVNRLFGNGEDDDNDGIIDETDEAPGYFNNASTPPFQGYNQRGEIVWGPDPNTGISRAPGTARAGDYPPASPNTPLGPPYVGLLNDDDSPADTTTNTSDSPVPGMGGGPRPYVIPRAPNGARLAQAFNARQLYARQLYVMMMLVADFGDTTGDAGYLWPEEWPIPGMTMPPLPKEIFSNGAQGKQERMDLRAARIAQWAVNVVDFADPDAIMTGFEFDLNPFNGWDVDGLLGSTDDNWTNPLTSRVERAVAWGCEHPEVLLTEAMATHDRRLRDLAEDDGNKKKRDDPSMPDETLDQVRIPQGSLFLELYSTRAPKHVDVNGIGTVSQERPETGIAWNSPPRELYNFDPAAQEWALDLGKTPPGGNDPVWRVALSSRPSGGTAPLTAFGRVNSADTANFKPHSTSFQPEDQSLFGGVWIDPTNNPLPDEDHYRYIWFTNQAPAPNHPDRNQIFFNTKNWNAGLQSGPTGPADAYLPAGGYAVIGPRPVTYFASKKPDMNSGVNNAGPSVQRIVLDTSYSNSGNQTDAPNGVRWADQDDKNIDPPRRVLPIICATFPPDGTGSPPPPGVPTIWNTPAITAPTGIGVNISEPMPNANFSEYYPEPTAQLANYPIQDAYGDPEATPPTDYLDEPLEIPKSITTNPTRRPERKFPITEDPLYPSDPNYSRDNLLETDTYEDYRTAYLQRLADPTRPYHVVNNPYITVDWMTIDLSVYNGEAETGAPPAMGLGNWDPYDANSDMADVKFGSRERGTRQGRASLPANTYPPLDLWETTGTLQDQTSKPASAAQDTYVPINFNSTFGFLNGTFWQAASTRAAYPSGFPAPGGRSAYFLEPNNPLAASPVEFLGAPLKPFPWIAWNNGPYASPYELMAVPASSPGRLPFEFSTYRAGDRFDPAPTNNALIAGYHPYRHLLNYHLTESNGNIAGLSEAPHLYRIFDFIETRSRFVGTERWYNSRDFGNPAGNNAPNTWMRTFRPPFNRLSRFRDPGKINLNMIFDQSVFSALLQEPPTSNWDLFQASRQGYVSAALGDFSPAVPTRFANPFRNAASSTLVPPPVASGPTALNLARRGIDSTVFRSRQIAPSTTNTGADLPLFERTFSEQYRDSDKHAWFRSQAFNRLGTMATTQSNVYAIWATVGFFEVEPHSLPLPPGSWDLGLSGNNPPPPVPPNGIDAGHPDGYRLKKELGWDTGEVRRHRAFYIVDRTIPVAFQPYKAPPLDDSNGNPRGPQGWITSLPAGESHNVEHCILLRRFIE